MEQIIPSEIAGSPAPVALYGHARPLPGRERALRERLQGFVTPTRAEDGCVAYHVHEDPAQPGAIAFYEHWASGHALAAHLALPTMQDFLATRHELLDGDLDITFLQPLAASA